MLDYETLKIIWWLLIGVLLIGFAIMDGHDMGVGTLLPWIGKNDEERRIVINTVGAHWEGNQTWFITGGGAIFAAWPLVYATAFSGFYWAMLAVLWAMFFRPVGFKYRSMIQSPRWRSSWDWGIFVGSFVPPVIFGVAFGNLFLGVPFGFNDYMMPHYDGSFWALLNPFALLCGLAASALLTLQGSTYLVHRTVDRLQARAIRATWLSGALLLVLFAAGGFWVSGLEGYQMLTAVDHNAALTPLDKQVGRGVGAWLHNFDSQPLLWALPMLGFGGAMAAMALVRTRWTLSAFVASSLAVLGVIGTAGAALFPFVLPSSSEPNASLTVWDSVSSQLTLQIMLVVTLIMMPIIVIYTSWAYHIMRGKVTAAYIRENDHAAY